MNAFGILLLLLCLAFCVVSILAGLRHQAGKYEKSRAANLRREVARHERGRGTEW